MKNSLLLVLFIVFSLVSYAQNFKNDGKPYTYYCEVFVHNKEIEIKWPDNNKEAKITNEKGEVLKFNNVADGLTYMSKRGWTVEGITVFNPNIHLNLYLLKKVVTSDQEAKEGLYFDIDFK